MDTKQIHTLTWSWDAVLSSTGHNKCCTWCEMVGWGREANTFGLKNHLSHFCFTRIMRRAFIFYCSWNHATSSARTEHFKFYRCDVAFILTHFVRLWGQDHLEIACHFFFVIVVVVVFFLGIRQKKTRKNSFKKTLPIMANGNITEKIYNHGAKMNAQFVFAPFNEKWYRKNVITCFVFLWLSLSFHNTQIYCLINTPMCWYFSIRHFSIKYFIYFDLFFSSFSISFRIIHKNGSNIFYANKRNFNSNITIWE